METNGAVDVASIINGYDTVVRVPVMLLACARCEYCIQEPDKFPGTFEIGVDSLSK